MKNAVLEEKRAILDETAALYALDLLNPEVLRASREFDEAMNAEYLPLMACAMPETLWSTA